MSWPAWWAPTVADFDARVRRFLVSLAQQGIQVRPTSGFRDPRTNAAVGGDPSSQHLVGTARDLVPVNITYAELASRARASGLFGFVLDESIYTKGTGAHVHVQLFTKGQLPPALFAELAGPSLPPAQSASFSPFGLPGSFGVPGWAVWRF